MALENANLKVNNVFKPLASSAFCSQKPESLAAVLRMGIVFPSFWGMKSFSMKLWYFAACRYIIVFLALSQLYWDWFPLISDSAEY